LFVYLLEPTFYSVSKAFLENRMYTLRVGLVIVLMFIFAGVLFAQNQQVRPCDTPEGKQLDFWLGEWQLTWPAEQWGGREGELGHGTNSITKILDDCIIQETFRFEKGGFNGHSVSMYNPAKKVWQQTWVDNQGGYLVFTGEFKHGRMELRTGVTEKENKKIVSRMVFKNINENSLDWDWQRSTDGGQNWTDVWNIHYERKK
jgi:hypothetical protein